ncbi:hypothetical protein IJH97_00945 [Candidatus Saccharibacteria bacterium]|nr:hypothetical protein [Candidatus Saccharibacteria bacterium]
MNTAEWILVVILSLTLLTFLIIGIILFVKLIGLTKEAKKVIMTSQSIADKADDVVDNVKDLTSVGGLVKTFVNRYTDNNKTGKKSVK